MNFLYIVSLVTHSMTWWEMQWWSSATSTLGKISSSNVDKAFTLAQAHESAVWSAKDLLKQDSAQVNSVKDDEIQISREIVLLATNAIGVEEPIPHPFADSKTLSVYFVKKQGTLQGLVVLNRVLYKRTLIKVHTVHVGRIWEKLQKERIKSLMLTIPPANRRIHCLTWIETV